MGMLFGLFSNCGLLGDVASAATELEPTGPGRCCVGDVPHGSSCSELAWKTLLFLCGDEAIDAPIDGVLRVGCEEMEPCSRRVDGGIDLVESADDPR